jgi:hypothetical protein
MNVKMEDKIAEANGFEIKSTNIEIIVTCLGITFVPFFCSALLLVIILWSFKLDLSHLYD